MAGAVRILALTLTVVTALTAFAQPLRAACGGQDVRAGWDAETVARVRAAAEAQPYAVGRLWEVEKDGAVSTLFGTVHLFATDIATPPEPLVDRLERARVLFVEATREEEARMQAELMSNPDMIVAPQGTRLSAHFSESEWDELRTAIQDFGLPAAMADRMMPWFLTLMLSVPACVMQEALEPGAAMLDRNVERVAEAADVPVRDLERFEDVFALFTAGSYEEQAEMLRLSLPAFAHAEDALKTTVELYREERIAEIWEIGVELTRRAAGDEAAEMLDKVVYEPLLAERNRNWMETLVPELERGDVVVAVGALHLGGRAGLLTMLEAEGFAIRRLND